MQAACSPRSVMGESSRSLRGLRKLTRSVLVHEWVGLLILVMTARIRLENLVGPQGFEPWTSGFPHEQFRRPTPEHTTVS